MTTSDHQCERGMIIRRTATGQKPAKALSPGVMLCLKLDESSRVPMDPQQAGPQDLKPSILGLIV